MTPTEVIVVPPTREKWSQSPAFRVEHLSKVIGSRCLVYFEDLSSAREFASAHTLWHQPCVVQSRDMPCTHEVRSVAISDPNYIFWTKRFGDLETARAEFDLSRERASVAGGSYLLIAAGERTPMAVYAKLGALK